MADTSLRRKLSVGTAMGLLLVPGCHAEDQALPYAEAIRTPLDEMSGWGTASQSVETDESVVGYRYPGLGGSHPLVVEARTSMAERQTAFLEGLPEGGHTELQQDMTVLAASTAVIGARITAVSSSGRDADFHATTLWYDAESGNVLPWTSLFEDEDAVERAHLAVATVLEDGYDLPLQQLPGLVGEAALRAQEKDGEDAEAGETSEDGEGAEEKGTGADLLDPEQAREAAEHWEGSPLEDVAFSTAGGLAVRLDAADVPGAGRVEEVVLPIGPEAVEDMLSGLGFRAREAALGGAGDDSPLGDELTAQGGGLDCGRLKCVALTFDDGPSEHTRELLDILAGYDAHATFYVLGSLVDEFPGAVKRMHAEGHELGNHTWKHDDMTAMSKSEVEHDIARTNQAVKDVIGSDPPTIRPPYGALNGKVRTTVDQPLILWDVDTLDWQSRDTDAVSQHALTHTVPGSVVLFHDIHDSSVRAIPAVLSELHRQGYHFVTVTDLFDDGMLAPGDVFTDARPQ